MLEKITDISLDSRFKESQKDSKRRHLAKRAFTESNTQHDSISISPAMIYLSKYNFKMNEIVKQSEGKLLLDFDIHNLNFKISIEQTMVAQNKQLIFVITKSLDDGIKKKSVTAWVKYCYGNISEHESVVLKFDAIHMLFDQIDVSQFKFDEKIFSPEMFELLIEGIENNLIEEFDALSHVVLIFVNKLIDSKIIDKLNSTSGSKSLAIQYIKQRIHEN